MGGSQNYCWRKSEARLGPGTCDRDCLQSSDCRGPTEAGYASLRLAAVLGTRDAVRATLAPDAVCFWRKFQARRAPAFC